jgi:hypothetical protein
MKFIKEFMGSGLAITHFSRSMKKGLKDAGFRRAGMTAWGLRAYSSNDGLVV